MHFVQSRTIYGEKLWRMMTVRTMMMMMMTCGKEGKNSNREKWKS